jgi:hypothetical protein
VIYFSTPAIGGIIEEQTFGHQRYKPSIGKRLLYNKLHRPTLM